jgi:hypothetical protein
MADRAGRRVDRLRAGRRRRLHDQPSHHHHHGRRHDDDDGAAHHDHRRRRHDDDGRRHQPVDRPHRRHHHHHDDGGDHHRRHDHAGPDIAKLLHLYGAHYVYIDNGDAFHVHVRAVERGDDVERDDLLDDLDACYTDDDGDGEGPAGDAVTCSRRTGPT